MKIDKHEFKTANKYFEGGYAVQLSEKEFAQIKEALIFEGWDETGFTWEHGIAYYHGIPIEEEAKRRVIMADRLRKK